jgi:hypothetical protein
VCAYRDILYTQRHTNVNVKGIQHVVQGVPVSTVTVSVTMDKGVVKHTQCRNTYKYMHHISKF